MTRTGRRWVAGCGCGCFVVLIALGLLGWGGYVYIMGIVNEAQRSEKVMAEVRERYGGLADFHPSAGPVVPAERVEAFVRARELMAGTRRETEASLSLLSSEGLDAADQVPGIVGQLLEWGLGAAKVGGARDLIPQAIGFLAARGEALLETGMGSGEYLYLYSVVYYSWLRRSPADGPSFPLVSDDESGKRQSGMDEFDVREGRRDQVLTRLNELLLPVLRRQLADLSQDGAADARWRKRLAAEITAMENDRFRIPWRDGLPEAMAASLEPYRRPLESSYSAMCNPLEVIPGSRE